MKIINIDGGIGRVIASIPALLKYQNNHPNEEWHVSIMGWDYVTLGIPELQDRTINPDTKGSWENYFMKSDELISPEPYRLPNFYKGKLSLVEAFDEIINQTEDHSDLNYETLNLSHAEIRRGQEIIYNTYQNCNLRFSQLAAHTMFDESNTATNLPAQIEINASKGLEYKFAFIQKGGGSANKAFLHQKTKAVLNPVSLRDFIRTAILELGTSACPPYHLAIVIGGTSAELTMKTVKMASIKALDNLPTEGNALGHAWRDLDWEAQILQITRDLGIGAQFGGKYYCHDVRVIRLPRHGASCPIGIGVSCSADRQAFAKITPDGLFIETLERDPAKFLPDLSDQPEDDVVAIDLNKPMREILASLSAHPVETRLALTGPLIVALRTSPSAWLSSWRTISLIAMPIASASTSRLRRAISNDRSSFSRSKTDLRPSRLTKVISRICTRSKVVNLASHFPHKRRRRIAPPSSAGRESFTCVSSFPQNGQIILSHYPNSEMANNIWCMQ